MGNKGQLENVAAIDYWNRLANETLDDCGIDGKQLAELRHALILSFKEVERDTRRRCAEMASALHGDILNSRPV